MVLPSLYILSILDAIQFFHFHLVPIYLYILDTTRKIKSGTFFCFVSANPYYATCVFNFTNNNVSTPPRPKKAKVCAIILAQQLGVCYARLDIVPL
jgi:hypothetical protein